MKMLFSAAFVSMGALTTAGFATGQGYAGPSFPCDGRLTHSEHSICHDGYLSELDRMMARHYHVRRDLAGPRGRKALQSDQKLWLRWRDTCGGDAGCLARRYEQRIIDLAPRDQIPPGFGCGEAGRFITYSPTVHPPAGSDL